MSTVSPPLLGRELPAFVRDLLGSAPKVGEGVDSWLYRTARLLHPYRHEPDIVSLLEAALHGERIRHDAIQRAVDNSRANAWQPGQRMGDHAAPRPLWPTVDHARQKRIVTEGPTAADLCDLSPLGYEVDDGSNADEIVEQLFSTAAVPDPLLCAGRSSMQFETRPMSAFMDRNIFRDWALIVPSTMTAKTGTTKEGKISEHSLENTGPRRFLVVEFDQGTIDAHSALLWHLAGYGPLALAVHSGSKSLHGWFYCQGETEPKLHRFMTYAVALGADRATWTRSQFVRMPAGQRENGRRQQVLYCDPAAINRTEEA